MQNSTVCVGMQRVYRVAQYKVEHFMFLYTHTQKANVTYGEYLYELLKSVQNELPFCAVYNFS